MKNIITAVFVFAYGSAFAQDNISKSSWVSLPVKVDGSAKDWALPLRYYDASTKLFFGFANDDKNLYLCFQSPDEANQMKIMRAGMKVTLKTKSKHKASISFPVAQKSQPPQASNESSGEQKFSHDNIKNTFLVQNTMMEVKGFETKDGLIPINDSSGINAAINWDETNKFTYEISIPFKELFGTDYSPANISQDMSLDVEINAATKQYHGGGDGFSGGGGRMGGGMHRNANADDTNSDLTSADKYAMLQKGELKQKFILASNSNPK